ncbi:6-phospho-beta-glucosidase [Thalassobacillus sp. CUG 92003]|uniref:6-phospho-beta-glucosidase n=1 Tax=Thalassobacillus sp. CUG 92003 TaxID=2736641 RepID=UPI0015E75881|nr:6-phospho-beta-glucosidase [Thalassobacillus sp. CUG 92003]
MSSQSLKIAVIGGGSSYTPELIEGLINRYHELPVQDLYLVDIKEGEEKLQIVGALVKRMFKKANLSVNVKLTLDRKEAIAGADFILTQIRVGLLEARARDERIPLRYQCIGQETTGAGGFSKALRTVPVILDICKEIEALAPEAFLINFTNPAGIVTEAVAKYSNVKSIGLCNLPIGIKKKLSGYAGVNTEDVDIEWVGINHLNWTTKLKVRGQDVMQEFLKNPAGDNSFSVKNIPDFAWDEDFLSSLGGLPCGYLRYYYMTDKMLNDEIEAAHNQGTRAEVVKTIEDALFKVYQDTEVTEKPEQLEQRGGAYYSLAAVNLISSIHNNKKDIQTVNIQNNGTMDFLEDEASIEVNCVIDAEGAHAIAIDSEIKPHMRGLIQIVKAFEELTVEAAVHGDYHTALQALNVHPLVPSVDKAKAILNDVLEENKHYLPQFQ